MYAKDLHVDKQIFLLLITKNFIFLYRIILTIYTQFYSLLNFIILLILIMTTVYKLVDNKGSKEAGHVFSNDRSLGKDFRSNKS